MCVKYTKNTSHSARGNLTPRQKEAAALVADGLFRPSLVREEDGWHARWRGVGVENAWIDDLVRSAAMTRLTEDAEDDQHETLHDAWMAALCSRTGLVVWDDAECADFARTLEEWSGSAEPDVAARNGIVFSFVPSEGGFSVACATPVGRRGLKALGQAAYVWGPLRALKSADTEGRTLRAELTRAEAEDFLRRGARELRDAGYRVDGVDISAEVTAEAEVGDEASSNGREIKLVVRVAGEPVTAQEVKFLLDQNSSIVYFRDHWIEVDRSILKEALRALEKGAGSRANPLSFALGLGHVGRLEVASARLHGDVRGFVSRLYAHGGDSSCGDEPPGFVGSLRTYQREGVAWLRFMSEQGFGALLADDMGLGKTIQTVAWLLWRKTAGTSAPVLVVAPLTLLANWEREIGKFAPALRVYVHQGDGRRMSSGFRRAAMSSDVVLTSYSLLVRDYSALSGVEWSALVLDEAQAVKNPDTHAARAIRSLSPRVRVALTGTPVENSVADLWSLEDFLNPGLLGDRKSFTERFVRPIAEDGRGAAALRLRRSLEPFVLRRLKTDESIAAELGDKREIREYCPLGPAERRAYEAALDDFRAVEHSPGDALALLTRLKLACDGFDGESVVGAKLDRLADLAGQIFESGESALVFTQYAKVGAALQSALESRLGTRFPFLHGGIGAAERERLVRGFQSSREPGLFILSLRAGGFGLNLTKATHVIHYDRWWNPAVESQATDRAHRIGQAKDVFVHLFVTAGTIEERVDEILQRKETLRDLIADGEAFWRAARLS